MPADISSGTYIFKIDVTNGAYTASAHRTIEIEVKDGIATIKMEENDNKFMFYGLMGISVLVVFLMMFGLIALRKKPLKISININKRILSIIRNLYMEKRKKISLWRRNWIFNRRWLHYF